MRPEVPLDGHPVAPHPLQTHLVVVAVDADVPEEVAEDPRRRELYRLWLARNCHFINNYVPIVMLATLANMDFQATTTKFGVIVFKKTGNRKHM